MPGWRSTPLKLHSISSTSATGWPLKRTAGGTIDARHERDCRDPEARGGVDPFLLSDHPDHRGRRRGRDQAGHLPPGAGRGPYGRRFLASVERPAAGRLRNAIRTGCRERVRRRGDGLFRLEPGGVSTARPPARDRTAVSDVQIEPHLRLDHEIGRGGHSARRGGECDAPRLCASEERAARAGHGRGPGRCPQHRGRCRSGQVSTGPHDPFGR